jgi:hypothetical protein
MEYSILILFIHYSWKVGSFSLEKEPARSNLKYSYHYYKSNNTHMRSYCSDVGDRGLLVRILLQFENAFSLLGLRNW